VSPRTLKRAASTRQVSSLYKTLQRTALPWGFFPYNVSKRRQRRTSGLPHPTLLRLQAFSTSWRLYSAYTLPALFHAESVHGVLLSEGSPSRKLPRLFAALVPSWSSPCTKKHSAPSGVYAIGRSVHSGAGFTQRPPVDPLIAFHSLRGIHPLGLGFACSRSLLS
jgi:hypothetical protein